MPVLSKNWYAKWDSYWARELFLGNKLELEMLVIKYNNTVHQHATSLEEMDTGN